MFLGCTSFLRQRKRDRSIADVKSAFMILCALAHSFQEFWQLRILRIIAQKKKKNVSHRRHSLRTLASFFPPTAENIPAAGSRGFFDFDITAFPSLVHASDEAMNSRVVGNRTWPENMCADTLNASWTTGFAFAASWAIALLTCDSYQRWNAIAWWIYTA